MRNACLALLLVPICSPGQWTQLPDFPGSARDDAAAFAIGTDVYVGTGMEVGWTLTNDWYHYDGSSMQWSTVASLPATPRQYCSAFVLDDPNDNFGYLFGGLDANGPLNELWRYDPGSDSWTQMASLPGEARYAAVAFRGGYIATGLLDGGSATNELWQYDPDTDSWQQLASVPGTARHRACGMGLNGLAIVGGADTAYHALDDCWTYDRSTDTWSACASLPEGRYGAMCGLAAYSNLVLGGATDPSTIVDTGFEFDLTSWLPSGDLHPGGPRRGGVLVEASGSGGPGTWDTYLGLGLSDALERKADWYVATGAFSIVEHSTAELVLHPNPGNTTFTLQLPELLSRGQLLVQDLSGRTVMDAPLSSTTVDASDWPSGSYLIQVIAADDRRFRGRWVKM